MKIYKVVKIPDSSYLKPVELEVYTKRSDSWRRVGVSLRPYAAFSVYSIQFLPTPFFGEALHWLVDNRPNQGSCKNAVILSFDINNETFEELVPPDHCLDGEDFGRLLLLFRRKLALIRFVRVDENKFECIWVIKEYGAYKSWNKPLVVPNKYVLFDGFNKRGLFLSHEIFLDLCQR